LDPPGGQPIEYRNILIFPRVMQGQVRQNLGRNRPNAGRIGQGEKKPRQSAPWILLEPNEADKKMIVAFLKAPNAKPAEPTMGGSAPSWSGGNQADEPPF